MRILLITGSYPPIKCGVGDYVSSLANAFTHISLVHVGILTSSGIGSSTEAINGVTILPVMNNWRLGEVLKLIKAIRAWSPDIVHIQYPSQGYDGILLPSLLPLISFFFGGKVVQTWHEFEKYDLRNLKYFFLRALIPCEVIVVRPHYKSHLPKFLQMVLWLKKFTYIRNGSSISKINLNTEDRLVKRKQYLKQQNRLIVFFGFIYPHKGVELLFDIADHETDCIVVAGGFDPQSQYIKSILHRANCAPWAGKVDFLGFVPMSEVSALLSVADAVVLPFREKGGGEWNSSIHAAVSHQSFVLTTSSTKVGYDQTHNIFYAKVDAISEMKKALNLYAGTRRKYNPMIDSDEWEKIAEQHVHLYSKMLKVVELCERP